jgi:hypothetical protein
MDGVGECEVISGHQRPSAAISGHQRSSAIISGHQRSSVVISGTHLSESKCCLRAVVSLLVRSSAKMVDTFGEASSALRTSPAGTGVNDDQCVNVNAGMGSSHGPMVSSQGSQRAGSGVAETLRPQGYARHQGQSWGNHVIKGSREAIKVQSRDNQGAVSDARDTPSGLCTPSIDHTSQ